ncbi:prepilin-type N-terminal cleavage/methylation domain-containing protein [Filobacillus milosensis]|uniref:Prepilin-type N-terminal cleavage/methylation domain-containing protein n=1 Tax=Filobacillus milosensis TaxID=94137 RepID=A0A4Y8IDA1_9BACI|nr:prepilin-type N-terminal cleavage/methylation domain-containing protein [Filobacillus milosensis]TFB13896.1 prepilin-type N-terminal cleavage/methylation domain-containing protein [Filobacillus milosensis]
MFKASRNLLKKEKGVTLVELLAVIIILGIIALIAVPAIAGVIEDSRYNSLKASAINAIEAAELHNLTQGNLPATETDLNNYYDGDGVSWTNMAFDEDTNGNIIISGSVQSVDDSSVSITLESATITEINNASVDGSASTITGDAHP